jgi:hypothetical protein
MTDQAIWPTTLGLKENPNAVESKANSMRNAIAIAALTCSILSNGIASEPPKPIKPLMKWSGTDSKQQTPEIAVCRSQAEWEANWKKHAGSRASCPSFDFNNQMMIVYFCGRCWADTIYVPDAEEDVDQIRARFAPISRQVGEPQDANSSVDESKKAATEITDNRPSLFAFVLLPTSSKAISIEEGEQADLGAPLVWHQKCHFPATRP